MPLRHSLAEHTQVGIAWEFSRTVVDDTRFMLTSFSRIGIEILALVNERKEKMCQLSQLRLRPLNCAGFFSSRCLRARPFISGSKSYLRGGYPQNKRKENEIEINNRASIGSSRCEENAFVMRLRALWTFLRDISFSL